MKKLLKLTAVLSVMLTVIACGKYDDTPAEPLLDVTANNISGTWKLTEWNGSSMDNGTYVYIEFTRRDQRFTIYQNQDSFMARKIEGDYNITTDESLGAVIRGRYDYGNGDWRHRYIVRNLTASSMTWIAVDDSGDVSLYERCESVPEDIAAEADGREQEK